MALRLVILQWERHHYSNSALCHQQHNVNFHSFFKIGFKEITTKLKYTKGLNGKQELRYLNGKFRAMCQVYIQLD